jgi:hypothetical protein
LTFLLPGNSLSKGSQKKTLNVKCPPFTIFCFHFLFNKCFFLLTENDVYFSISPNRKFRVIRHCLKSSLEEKIYTMLLPFFCTFVLLLFSTFVLLLFSTFVLLLFLQHVCKLLHSNQPLFPHKIIQTM